MQVGIGLPNAVPGTPGRNIVEFAKAAEEAGFSSLGTIDRVAYPNYEPLTVLAAAAAVTERIKLATTILLAPLHGSGRLIAKQALSIDALAGGGRVVLGIAVGGRGDDYELTGVPISQRGRIIDQQIAEIRAIFDGEGEAGEKIGPAAIGAGPSLITGGGVDASFERAARYGDGWTMGGGTPDQFRESVDKLRAAWEREGREGEPRRMALAYFSLGSDAEKNAQDYLGHYYAFLGEELAGMITAGAAKDADTVRGYLQAFEDAGCDELILFPCSSDPGQVTLLAEAAGL